MIARYTLPEMGKIWSENNHFQQMLEVELLVCEAMKDNGVLDKVVYQEIVDKAGFDVQRIAELEAVTHHDVVAFLQAVGEKIGAENVKALHKGMTASDVLDTALAVQLVQSTDVIVGRLHILRDKLAKLAKEHKHTLMVGRTHGMHAEPITFGLKMVVWMTEIDRQIQRMKAARKSIAVGKVSGAVGTYAHVDPYIEAHVCRSLDLKPAKASSQIIQRDRHAHYVTTLALVGSSLEKFATEMRQLIKTEVSEISEPMVQGMLGSSALPHKINPIRLERIVGLSRVLRGNSLTAMENVALWHERDLTHSSAERIVLADSCILLDYMTKLLVDSLDRVHINPDMMMENIQYSQGLIFSQRVMIALEEHGIDNQSAFCWVQRNAIAAYEDRSDFAYYLMQDSDIMEVLTFDEINELLDYDYFTRHIDFIYERVGL